MIDIKQGALRALQKDPLTLPDCTVHQQTGIGCQGDQPGSQPVEQGHVLVELGALTAAHQLQQLIGSRDPVSQKDPGTLDSPKIGDSNAPAPVLILVGWTDATSGRAQFLA